MAKAKFNRTKPHVNLVIIGGYEHGKTTLAKALMKVSEANLPTYQTYKYEPLNYTRGELKPNISVFEFESMNRHYTVYDPDGYNDFFSFVLSSGFKPDGAIFAVSCYDNLTSQTESMVKLLSKIGVTEIVAALTKADVYDEDDEFIEFTEYDINDCLEENGYFDKPIARVKALGALESPKGNYSILRLIDDIDQYIEQPERETEKPFVMPIDDVYTIADRGVSVTGKIERGCVVINDKVELVGAGVNKTFVVTGIEMFKKMIDEAVAGDNVGLLLRGAEKKDFELGQILAVPNKTDKAKVVLADIYLLSREENGLRVPMVNGYTAAVAVRNARLSALFNLKPGEEMAWNGDYTEDVKVTFSDEVPVEKGLTFSIHKDGRTIGFGIVTNY